MVPVAAVNTTALLFFIPIVGLIMGVIAYVIARPAQSLIVTAHAGNAVGDGRILARRIAAEVAEVGQPRVVRIGDDDGGGHDPIMPASLR